MNKNLISGIIIIVLVLAGLFYWFSKSKANEAEVESITKKIEKVDTTVFSNSTFESVKQLNKNGDIPVETAGQNLGKANPFQ